MSVWRDVTLVSGQAQHIFFFLGASVVAAAGAGDGAAGASGLPPTGHQPMATEARTARSDRSASFQTVLQSTTGREGVMVHKLRLAGVLRYSAACLC